jgi:hypothetical protein
MLLALAPARHLRLLLACGVPVSLRPRSNHHCVGARAHAPHTLGLRTC